MKKRIILAISIILLIGVFYFVQVIEVEARGRNYICVSSINVHSVRGGTVSISSAAFRGPSGTHFRSHVVPNISSPYTFRYLSTTHFNMYNSWIHFEILLNGVVVYRGNYTSHRSSSSCFWSDVDPWSDVNPFCVLINE